MKTCISIFITWTVLFSTLTGFSQNLQDVVNSEELDLDTISEITSLIAAPNSGKVYLKWKVKNQSQDGIYLIYRSANGIDYNVMGCKKGVGVPISNEIAYFFVDEKPAGSSLSYKIIHVSSQKNYLISNSVVVENKQAYSVSR